jgi:plastocyanin
MGTLKVLAIVLAGLALSASKPAASPSVIEMTPEMTFMPRVLSVMMGEIVVWKNVAKEPHSVNTIPENCFTEEGKKWIQIPQGAEPFFSGEIKGGEEWRMRFDKPGTYQYLCTFHEHALMRGTVIVSEVGVK